MKRKGKIHPSPPQPAESSQHSADAGNDSLSVLNLLPAAILALAAVLSLHDREVLAYMIARSLKTPTTSSIDAASSVHESKKFYHRNSHNKQLLHQPPVFDCECFDCYTSFWFRWDSSPNREVIHQAIEAFEEHLLSGEVKVKVKGSGCSNRRGRKKEKPLVHKLEKENQIPNPIFETSQVLKHSVDETTPLEVNSTPAVEEEEVVAAVATGHKGFVRKVLPDVLGLFNSRLWNLWGLNR